VADFELGTNGPDPLGETVIVFLGGCDAPAHDEEHDVQASNQLGNLGDIWEVGQDVGKELAEGVRLGSAGRVEERRYGRVRGPDE
jgi:hypothetical protein